MPKSFVQKFLPKYPITLSVPPTYSLLWQFFIPYLPKSDNTDYLKAFLLISGTTHLSKIFSGHAKNSINGHFFKVVPSLCAVCAISAAL
jgi:hypothetical protein